MDIMVCVELHGNRSYYLYNVTKIKIINEDNWPRLKVKTKEQVSYFSLEDVSYYYIADYNGE